MNLTEKPQIVIVNDSDEIVGYKLRDELSTNEIYRVSALWVTNSQGEILLARRHRNKKHHPGRRACAVAGTVEKGETYESNIIKEAEEELGLKNIIPKTGPKTKMQGDYYHFTQRYTLLIDHDIDQFIIQEDEVEEIKWFTPQELGQELKKYPEEFLPNMEKYILLFCPEIKE